MRKSKFTELQIVGILRQQQEGKSVNDICRSHGVTSNTFYRWKSKYAGLDAAELTRMKEMEKELSQYKKMYAELAKEHYVLKDVLSKKW
ncbi:transposase [Fluviicola sp. SGL-29]|nr:transposase [Fluviicola sp. SGL-29]